MIDDKKVRGPRVHRAAATATWEHEYRWGGFGDTTRLAVSRTDGGQMTIRFGDKTVEIRAELVPLLAEMVAAASTWSDATTQAEGDTDERED